MNNVHRAKLVMLLSLAGMFVVGCPNKNKEQMRALYQDMNTLRANNNDLKNTLVKAREKEAELQTLLDSKDGEILVANATITDLEGKLTICKRDHKGIIIDGGNGNGPKPKGKTWIVGGDVLFAAGQATLTTAGRRELNTIIQQLDSRYKGMPIRVYGHTDSDPIRKSKWKDNLQLSGARAMEVRRYMVAKGITAANIETIAMGSSDPVVPNERTKADKQRNRRVVIKVIGR